MSEVPPELPGLCTDITVQKKRKNRVSLYVDGRFLAGFNRNTIERAGVQKDTLITEERYRQLLREEERFLLREQLYRWLAVRDHATGEIRKKCQAKGYSSEQMEEIIREFTEKGFLDDLKFAKQFAASKSGGGGWGPLKIQAALSKKGVKKSYIAVVLEGLHDNDDSEEELLAAAKSAKTRLLRTEAGIRRKKKLTDFLIRRGFPGQLVYEKADTVLTQLENEET